MLRFCLVGAIASRLWSWTFIWLGARRAFGAAAPGLTALTTQYDGEHYLRIAREGYVRPGLWAFFPLFPLSTKLTGSAAMVWAGLALNLLFLWAALSCLHELVIAHTND